MKKHLAAVAFAVAGVAGTASADTTILSFGFTDLDGRFNLGTSRFEALGVNVAPLQSQGDVSRVNLPGPGTATYLPGQAAGLFSINLVVSGIVGLSATGTGNVGNGGGVNITDADGDTFHADINGQFISNGIAVFFHGSLSNIFWTDNGPQDGLFNGPGIGAIPLSFAPAPPPYLGAIVQLYIGDVGGFFVNNFTGISTQASGVVVPAPSSLALIGLGGLIAARRRRA